MLGIQAVAGPERREEKRREFVSKSIGDIDLRNPQDTLFI